MLKKKKKTLEKENKHLVIQPPLKMLTWMDEVDIRTIKGRTIRQ